MNVFHAGRHASAALVAVACASSAAPAAPPVDAGQLRVIDDRLNRTGRPLLLPTAVRHDGSIIGEVLLTIAVDDSIQVERDALVALLTPHLNPQLIAALATQPSATPLAALRSFEGISLTYERSTLELVLVTTADSGTDQPLSLRPRITGPPPLPPAPFSAYVNVTTLLNHAWESPTSSGHSGLSFNFEGAARFMDFVLEGEASLDGPLDSFICPVEASCTYAHSSGLKRQGTRLVKDLPEFSTRVTVGDLSYWAHPLQRGNDLVGFSVRHEAQKFGVNERLDSATTSILSLDTSADVEVIVNGAPLQRLRLKAGTYRLSDLPLNAGTNDVQLVVTTDTGERRVVRVKALNHDTMLAPGNTEWSFAAGVASYIRDHEREYVADDPVVNAHFRMGLNHHFTIGVHAQADAQVVMGGGGVLALTPFGLWGLSLAASMTTEDTDLTGYAATLSWEYLPPVEPGAGRQSIRAQADYRSSRFITPGDALLDRSGILYPTFVPLLRLSTAWSTDLPPSLQLGLSARYAFANPDTSLPGAVQTDVDRWGVSLSLTSPVTASLTATSWVGYGNERLLSFTDDYDASPDFQVGVRFAWVPKTHVHVRAETDSLTRQTTTAATTRHGPETNLWTTSVHAMQAETLGSSVAGTVTHSGRFAESVVSHTANGPLFQPETHYTSLRSTSSFAFAGGQFAIGPPIRDAFVLVRPHPSIAESNVTVGALQTPTATGSRNLPAMLAQVPSYATTSHALDATDLPLGYSLGTAILTVTPPYKAGYAIEVGSDAALSVYGTLLDARGAPVALASGYATPRDRPTPKIALFTNSVGHFGIEGLSEGAWIITLTTANGLLLYELAVFAGPTALINAGTLSPSVTVETPDAPSHSVVADVPGRD